MSNEAIVTALPEISTTTLVEMRKHYRHPTIKNKPDVNPEAIVCHIDIELERRGITLRYDGMGNLINF